jgi:hypothetical protein
MLLWDRLKWPRRKRPEFLDRSTCIDHSRLPRDRNGDGCLARQSVVSFFDFRMIENDSISEFPPIGQKLPVPSNFLFFTGCSNAMSRHLPLAGKFGKLNGMLNIHILDWAGVDSAINSLNKLEKN